MTDATGCPGHFCKYIGRDLYVDATHKCDLRTGGAQNWEAWIKDTRDDELYRIVLMPDDKWWLAQNVRYAGTGSSITITGCTPEICGKYYSQTQFNGAYGGSSGYGENKQGVCPNGWILPIFSNWTTLFDSISGTPSVVCARLRAANSTCSPILDYYGWSNKINVCYKNWAGLYNDHWVANDGVSHLQRMDGADSGNACNVLGQYNGWNTAHDTEGATVRCFRQL
jgi:uncharacterized protein (TIGR02145 family)